MRNPPRGASAWQWLAGAVLLLASVGRAPAEPESREYDVGGILAPIEDHAPVDLELRPPAQWVREQAAGAAKPEPRCVATKETLELLARACAQAGVGAAAPSVKWESAWRLHLTAEPEAHAAFERVVEALRARTEERIDVEGTIVMAEDALLERLAVRSGPLAEPVAEALTRALDRGDGAGRVAQFHAVCRNGQRVTVTESERDRAYLAGYEASYVESEFSGYMPFAGVLRSGAGMTVRPVHMRGRIACDVEFERQQAAAELRSFDTRIAGTSPLELPEARLARVGGSVAGTSGQTFLVGRVAAPGLAAIPGLPAMPGGRSVCFLVRIALREEARPGAVPAGPEDPAIVDAGMLTEAVGWDFAGPALSIFGYGAAAALWEDPERGWRPAQAEWMARLETGFADWTEPGPRLRCAGGLMFIAGAPGARAQVEASLDALAERRVRMVTTRAAYLAVTPGALEGVEREHPAIGMGGGALDADGARRLLERSRVGRDGVSLVGYGEAIGFAGQRVSVQWTNLAAVLMDVDVAWVTKPVKAEPRVDVRGEGFVLDASASAVPRPVPGRDGAGGPVQAAVRMEWVRLLRPFPEVEARGDRNRLELPALEHARIRHTLRAPAGAWWVAGVTGPQRVHGEDRYVVALMACE